VYLQGQIVPVDGTSCSSPVFAAIVSLINAQRLKMGKRTLGQSDLWFLCLEAQLFAGFFTPALYKAPASAFHDITKGDNKCTESCCGEYGFLAAKGWVGRLLAPCSLF
jgi:tripeptidyl-peptidase-1